jgi:hypothetical protein
MRQPPGYLADFGVGQPEDLGHFPHRHAWLKQHMAGNHGGMTRILGQDRIQHRIAFIPGEIHIDIRRVFAARI